MHDDDEAGSLGSELISFSGTTNLYATDEGECIQTLVASPHNPSFNELLRMIAKANGEIVELIPLVPGPDERQLDRFLVVYRVAADHLLPKQNGAHDGG